MNALIFLACDGKNFFRMAVKEEFWFGADFNNV